MNDMRTPEQLEAEAYNSVSSFSESHTMRATFAFELLYECERRWNWTEEQRRAVYRGLKRGIDA